jgi:hypothetical protein
MPPLVVIAFLSGCADPAAERAEQMRRAEQALPLQKKAATAEWRWPEDKVSLSKCASSYPRDGYNVEIIPNTNEDDWHDWHNKFIVRVLEQHSGKVAYSFKAHAKTVFVQIGDVIYWADYVPNATGCSIVACDLKKQLHWTCQLLGNPPLWHSQYLNQVNIAQDGDLIVVYGKESNGRYIEYVDTKSGKTVGHKSLPPSSDW